MNEKLVARLQSTGPKRLLALDGGGIRGVLTLEFLERIEAILASRSGNPKQFHLSDYFDLIGGTSTGSIIAAMLACGYSVAEIKKLYHELAAKVFKRRFWRMTGVFVPKFPAKPLRDALELYLGEKTTLGSDKILTGLMVMTKRLDTGSPWPLHNCPNGPYYDPDPWNSEATANKDYLLAAIVRASTAAPSFFKPESISVANKPNGEKVDGHFVDGGVSPSNNPALQLLMLAALKGYGFRWPLGADKLLLVSVGTGSFLSNYNHAKWLHKLPANVALYSLKGLMDDSDNLAQTMLQWMACTSTPWMIDSEIGNLRSDQLVRKELLTYLRYNVKFDEHWLQQNFKKGFNKAKVKELEEMDNFANIGELKVVGRRSAQVQVRDSHFPRSFD